MLFSSITPSSKLEKWRSLEQNGVSFTPDYEPHNVKLLYDGEPVELTPAQEEVASFYAAMPPDGPQLGNPKTAKVFNANFFGDFKVPLREFTHLG
jgi:DNA topoisomerase-1